MMITELVLHDQGRDAKHTGKLIDVVAIHDPATVQPLLQTGRWRQEFGGEGTIALLPLGVRLSEQRIRAR